MKIKFIDVCIVTVFCCSFYFHLFSAPEDEDLTQFVQYLGELVLDKNLEMVDLLIKHLHRFIFEFYKSLNFTPFVYMCM